MFFSLKSDEQLKEGWGMKSDTLIPTVETPVSEHGGEGGGWGEGHRQDDRTQLCAVQFHLFGHQVAWDGEPDPDGPVSPLGTQNSPNADKPSCPPRWILICIHLTCWGL